MLTFCSLGSQQKYNFSPILKSQYQACNRQPQDNQASPDTQSTKNSPIDPSPAVSHSVPVK